MSNARKLPRPPTVTLIGAGSQIFGFNMCADICQTPALKGATVHLVDVDAQRLTTMDRLFHLVSQSRGMELRISSTTDRREALPETDYVILSVAAERIRRWDIDLALSRKYGMVEVQGECGGPGGLSLTLRNVPLVLEIARDIEALAPGAVLLNFTNPMTRICRALNRYTGLRTVGLCHGLVGVQAHLSRLLGRDVAVTGCGINHFNWIFAARWHDTGSDAWPAVRAAFLKDDDPHWAYTRELCRVFERIVTPGDGHITDFTHHWRGAGNGLNPRYALRPKNMDDYREFQARWEDRIAGYLTGRQDPWADVHGLSGEGAIPIVCAMSGLSPEYEEIAVNIPNRGAMKGLPDDAVVEVPARVSPHRIVGRKMGPLPLALQSLIARQLEIGELAVEAAVEGSFDKALQALSMDPIVADLAVARDYLNDVLAAHGDVLPQFKHGGAEPVSSVPLPNERNGMPDAAAEN